MATARVTAEGRITVPKEVRERLGIAPGDTLEFHFEGDRLELRPIRRRHPREFRGIFRVDRVIPFENERHQAWSAQVGRLVNQDGADSGTAHD